MNCAEVSEKIELFVLGGLSESEQAAIKAHVAVCPACNAAQGRYRLLVTQIKGAAQPEPLRLDFVRAVRSAAKAEIRLIALRSLARRIITIAGSLAACLFFALMVWSARFSICDLGFSIGNRKSAIGNRQSVSSVSGAPSILQAWQHSGVRSVPGSMADGVTVRGRNLYLLQECGGQARVAALDVKTGKQKWLSDAQSCGYLVADLWRVYCLAPGQAGQFDLVALDATDGKTLWKYPQQRPAGLRSLCRPTLLSADRICWTTNAAVHVLSCANGQPLWTHSIAEGGLLSAAVVVDDNLYVANSSGLYCLNVATGDESWVLPYGQVVSGWDRPLLAAAEEEIYAALNLGFGASRLLCIELTGQGSRGAGAGKILWSEVVGHVTDLHVVGDILYLRDQNVQALDRTTGQLLWTYSATGCNPLTYTEDLAYFVDSSDRGRLIALNRYTGCKVWEVAGVRSCTAFVKVDSTGFVKTNDGVVYAVSLKG